MNSQDGKRTRTSAIRIDIPSESESFNSSFPKEKRKTLIALGVLTFNFILATVSLALTNQRLPDRTIYKPLPDIVLDNVATQDWALYVSEILIMISVAVTVTVLFLHRHRYDSIYDRIFINYNDQTVLFYFINICLYLFFKVDCIQTSVSNPRISVLDEVCHNVRYSATRGFIHILLFSTFK